MNSFLIVMLALAIAFYFISLVMENVDPAEDNEDLSDEAVKEALFRKVMETGKTHIGNKNSDGTWTVKSIDDDGKTSTPETL